MGMFGKIILVLIVIGIIGYGGYYFGNKNNNPQAIQNQIYNQPSVTSSTTSPTETIAPTADETSVLINDVRTGLIAEHGNDAASLNITVKKIEGDYASGAANEPVGGGGMWFAAKVNGTWKVVDDGNGIILCSKLTAYPNFPTDILPNCYDDKTQNLVKR